VAGYLILGAGKFGHLALQRLHLRSPRSEFWLVDFNPQKLSDVTLKDSATHLVGTDAIAFLEEALNWASPPEWIIPAIPRHVAFNWLWRRRPPECRWHRVEAPAEVGQNLPFRQIGAEGELYLSLSTVLCPDDCPSPADSCYLTGFKRPFDLYGYLENLSCRDYSSLVVRSQQLAPGVGGYRPADLWHLWEQVLALTGKILISTACRCHGVSHCIQTD